jgi:hypothetical protein
VNESNAINEIANMLNHIANSLNRVNFNAIQYTFDGMTILESYFHIGGGASGG